MCIDDLEFSDLDKNREQIENFQFFIINESFFLVKPIRITEIQGQNCKQILNESTSLRDAFVQIM